MDAINNNEYEGSQIKSIKSKYILKEIFDNIKEKKISRNNKI